MIKVLIIDDDKMICFALKTIIENEADMEVIGLGHNFDDAIKLYHNHKPDICLFDIQIGEKTGLDALEKIKEIDKNVRVLFLTTFLDKEYINQALKLGSCGYLLKDEFESICPSIRAVYAGQSVFGNKVINNISQESEKDNVKEHNIDNLKEKLSQREIDILEAIADGLNNKEISNKLYLSEGTVRNYISSMLVKLDLRDRTQLAIYYLKNI